ncbi:zinc metalloprotease HtpX [Roseomonas populi]|uniref:Protease HtpX homolog n=1 Tax=Roseomonas populi TaxID=3121582 RepID=A0ABT1X901_9PROT|nr:zinc metalloprotease HtpX [Roseomonas pecuniae]MCR0984585.1 zinc metalloprotease HtpX [Roseomonas pecuniae]
MSGYARTAILMAGMVALFAGVGFLLGGRQGMVIAFLFGVGTNLFAWWNSDRMVLRMHNAQPIGPAEEPRLHAMVAALAARAGVPVPALYVIHEDQPNAFATGRSPEHSAVAVSTGLLAMMPEEEVAGVVAHELAHIRNRDTLIMTVAASLAGAIGVLAQFGGLFGHRDRNNPLGGIGVLLAIVVAPLAAMVVQMAVSRSREYEADRVGAMIAGGPIGLARALQRLEAGRHAIPNGAAEANPGTAHLFIVNPLSGRGMDSLFSTHPSTENRVRALLEMAGGMPMGGTPGGFMGGSPGGSPGGPAGGFAPGPAPGPWSGRASRRPRSPWG